MGLYHSVGIAFGFEIPTDTDYELLDKVIGDGPDLLKDSVGHIVVGDMERLLLVTRYTPVEDNEVARLAGDALAQPGELAVWEAALHDVAVRVGHTDHPAPTWLVVHNYR